MLRCDKTPQPSVEERNETMAETLLHTACLLPAVDLLATLVYFFVRIVQKQSEIFGSSQRLSYPVLRVWFSGPRISYQFFFSDFKILFTRDNLNPERRVFFVSAFERTWYVHGCDIQHT